MNIYFVGTSSKQADQVTPTLGNVYEINSNQVITPIVLKVNITGYTNIHIGNQSFVDLWDSSFVHSHDFETTQATIGQFFVIVDGEITQISGTQIHQDGITISPTLGDHTVTVLYAGMENHETWVYIHETIILRIREDGQEFDDYKLIELPVEKSIMVALSEENISGQAILVTGALYERTVFLKPNIGLTSQYNSKESVPLNIETGIFIDENSPGNLTLEGVANLTGFSGLQVLGTWESSQGILFFSDASGLHEIDKNTVSIRDGLNTISLVSLTPYGIWHKDVPCPPIVAVCSGFFGPDWDSEILVGVNSSTLPIGPEIDSSFDFIGNSSVVSFFTAIGQVEEIRSTEGDTPLNLLSVIATFVVIVKWKTNPKKRYMYVKEVPK